MRNVLFLYFLVNAFFSCKTEKNSIIEELCKKNQIFKIDTPIGFYNYRSKVTYDYLGLKSINKSSDTFTLRINKKLKDRIKIFEVDYFQSQFAFRIYEFNFDSTGFIKFDRKIEKASNYSREISDKINIAEFTQKLQTENILELPDCETIPKYPLLEYGRSRIVVTFTSKCIYKLYTYEHVYDNQNNFKEAKKLVNLLNYLEEKTGF